LGVGYVRSSKKGYETNLYIQTSRIWLESFHVVSVNVSGQIILSRMQLTPRITTAFAAFPLYTLGFVLPQNRVVTVDNTITTKSTLYGHVGIFFGTSTGSTEEVADLIKQEFGDDADGPFDVERLEGSVKSNFEKYDALVVGSELLENPRLI
jgi:hypothetical protein